MIYEGYKFEVYKNKFPPYHWLFLVADTRKNIKHESSSFYPNERKAVQAVFEFINKLKEDKIQQQLILPSLN